MNSVLPTYHQGQWVTGWVVLFLIACISIPDILKPWWSTVRPQLCWMFSFRLLWLIVNEIKIVGDLAIVIHQALCEYNFQKLYKKNKVYYLYKKLHCKSTIHTWHFTNKHRKCSDLFTIFFSRKCHDRLPNIILQWVIQNSSGYIPDREITNTDILYLAASNTGMAFKHASL